METKNTKMDFSNQTVVTGIDTHKKQWKVSLRNSRMELKTFSMNPSPEDLYNYLKKNYPGASYKSVYEAGFCGFSIHRKLQQLGIENIVVNPGDVPTRNKERGYRTDKIDARKLARELEGGTISGIYIPTEEQEELRSLSRLRQQLVKDQTRIKNRIKGLLLYYGKDIPDNSEMSHWSGRFIEYLEGHEFYTETGKQCLQTYIADLRGKREKILQVLKILRQVIKQSRDKQTIKNLCSVPGVSFITAITLYTELIDINRFSNMDKLCSFVGLIPSISSSADHEVVLGITNRHNKYLRNLLIESAWSAVRGDPALTEKFCKLTVRMSKQKAIIRIAKKLLRRISFVWKNNKPYEMGKKK
jgi:transposase